MKNLPRPVIAAAIVLLAALGWYLFGRSQTQERWLGYVEGEARYIAAPVPGRLASLAVERGARVPAGAVLFALDPAAVDADTDRLAAQVAAARAQAADLAASRQREADMAVLRAAESAAAAQLQRARKDYDRAAQLAQEGIASREQLDAARAGRDTAQAALDQARAQIRAGEASAGRAGQLRAAGAEVAGAQAALRGQQQRRADIAPPAPVAGVIEQTFYNPGEWVPAAAPVVALLPDDARMLRFYVPQDRIATLRQGESLRFTCDGCAGEGKATVSYIAPRAEFSPPVIYSEHARAKLVFMVEARLAPSAKPLPPGLPVEVIPPAEPEG